MIKDYQVNDGGTSVGSCSINTNLTNNARQFARQPITNGNNNSGLTPSDNQKRCKVTRFKGSMSDDRLIKCRNKFLDIEEELCTRTRIVRVQTPIPAKGLFQELDDCDDENAISPPPPLPITNPPSIPICPDSPSTDKSDDQLSLADDGQSVDDLLPKIENFSVKFEKTVSFVTQSPPQDKQPSAHVGEQEFRPIHVSESTENLAHIVVRPIAVYPSDVFSKSVQDLSTIGRDEFRIAPLTMTRSTDDLLLPDIDGLRRPLNARQKYAKSKSQENVNHFANGKPSPLPRSSLLGVNGGSKKLVYILDRSKNEFVLEPDGDLVAARERDDSKNVASKLKMSFCGLNSEDSDNEPYTVARKKSADIEGRQILPRSLEEPSGIVPVLKSNSIFYVQAPTTSRCK